MPQFSGTVALVTGGGRGMGAVICEKLAECGAVVAVTDASIDGARETSERINSAGGNSQAFHLDVTSYEKAESVVGQVTEALGPIGILVNNAGVSSFVPFLSLSEAEFDRILAINVKGVFNLCKSVLPGMVERMAGRVINMASILGKMGEPNFAHYASSKFAIVGLTQSLAAEMAQYDITVNSVCPGIVETPMWTDIYRDALAGSDMWSTEQEVRDWVLERIPLHRTQPPEDIAEMVAFLASDLGRNMTGGSYHVDGGMVPR
jgi:NAD(P)-dependent dehydrogenase (short-subunit alcohol dehydrogenase family)